MDKSINVYRKHDIIYYKSCKALTKRAFRKYLKLGKNSYVSSIFDRMLDYFTDNAIKLYREYDRYYKKEFKTFKVFLEIKHNLPDDRIEMFCNKNSYYKRYDEMPEKNIDNIFYDNDDIKNLLFSFIGGN